MGEDALYAARSINELQEAWSFHCDHFEDESPERERLLALFRSRFAVIQPAERAAACLRAG